LIDILSLGSGVQSSFLALTYDFNLIIISNTGSEKPATYKYLAEYLLPVLEEMKKKVVILHPKKWDEAIEWYKARGYDIPYSLSNNSSIHEEFYGEPYFKRISLHFWYHEDKSLPFKMYRGCTDNWKTKPIYRYLKDKNITEANMILGFSYDEIQRMKDNPKRGFTNKFPLVDERITRDQIVQYYKNNNIPRPDKSGCFGCPFSKKSEWQTLKRKHKPLFDFTCEIEERAFIDLPLQVPPQTFYPLWGNHKLKDRFNSQNLLAILDIEEIDDDPFCGESCFT
jgi:hypothetical protein